MPILEFSLRTPIHKREWPDTNTKAHIIDLKLSRSLRDNPEKHDPILFWHSRPTDLANYRLQRKAYAMADAIVAVTETLQDREATIKLAAAVSNIDLFERRRSRKLKVVI